MCPGLSWSPAVAAPRSLLAVSPLDPPLTRHRRRGWLQFMFYPNNAHSTLFTNNAESFTRSYRLNLAQTNARYRLSSFLHAKEYTVEPVTFPALPSGGHVNTVNSAVHSFSSAHLVTYAYVEDLSVRFSITIYTHACVCN